MKIEKDDALGSADPLECPKCGGANLHHEKVEVYFRKEDAKNGIGVSVDGGLFGGDPQGFWTHGIGVNPSDRRSGVRVHFVCESCGPEVKHGLTIVQHKGSTYLEWEGLGLYEGGEL